jgi:hypothetical protein
MKSTNLLIIAFLLSVSMSIAQNTFPTTGNVGIGTITPTTPLHVTSASTSGTTLIIANTGTPSSTNFIGLSINEGQPVATFRYRRDYTGITEIGSLVLNEPVSFISGNNERIRLANNGNVGIGTSNPNNGNLEIVQKATGTSALHIGPLNSTTLNPTLSIRGQLTKTVLKVDDGTSSALVGSETNNDFGILTNNTVKLLVTAAGKVQIGTVSITSPDYKLFVETGILTEKVKVAIKNQADWNDHVFNNDYKLMSLKETETYVKENKHLPNIPSADEVVKNGLDLGKMDAALLGKIEELTLHLIQLSKKVEKLEEENIALRLKSAHESKN